MSTREKILEAALKLFSQKGYLGATTKEIAREAGIAEVTLFRHFSSKEKLFEEVMNTGSFLPALRELLPEIEKMEYEEALNVIAARFLEILHRRKDLIRIMHSEFQRYPDKIHETFHYFIDEIFRTLASYFSNMQKRGVLRPFDAEYGARAFLGMFFAYFNSETLMMRGKYRTMDRDLTIKNYVNVFVNGTLK